MGKSRQKSVWFFIHNLLMVGSPGTGKTLLARTIADLAEALHASQSSEINDELVANPVLYRI